MAASGLLTALIAAFFSPIYAVHPHFGGSFTMMAFIIVVLGGMGNLLGVHRRLCRDRYLLRRLTSTEIADHRPGSFIAVILVRPQGLQLVLSRRSFCASFDVDHFLRGRRPFPYFSRPPT
jgi:hypothetical protein